MEKICKVNPKKYWKYWRRSSKFVRGTLQNLIRHRVQGFSNIIYLVTSHYWEIVCESFCFPYVHATCRARQANAWLIRLLSFRMPANASVIIGASWWYVPFHYYYLHRVFRKNRIAYSESINSAFVLCKFAYSRFLTDKDAGFRKFFRCIFLHIR